MLHWPRSAMAAWFRWSLPHGASPTTLHEREHLRRARLLSIALLSTGLLTLPLMLQPLGNHHWAYLISEIIYEVCLGCSVVLNRIGRFTLASWLYIIGYLLYSCMALFFNGAEGTPVLMWVHYMIPIIFSGLLLPYWTPMVFGLLCGVLISTLIVALPENVTHRNSLLPYGFLNYLIYIYVMIGAVTTISTVSAYIFERAVTEADRTQELQEAHDALETLHEKLTEAYAMLEEVAVRDAITGLLNHRALEERLAEEVARSQREGIPLGVIFADLDHFKRFNDTWGHKVGDVVLAHLAHQLTSYVREIDTVARYGGEEFVVLLPGAAFDEAHQTAERLREVVATTPLELEDGTRLEMTISMGVAVFPLDGATIHQVVEAADQAMYRAKRTGRNRVCTVQDLPGGEKAA